MAVATPVLERKLNTEERYASMRVADERHNAMISENYAKLINPEMNRNDLLPAESEVKHKAISEIAMPDAPARSEEVYLVENARADADIFRADSAINRRSTQLETVAQADSSEEENEDLRPTLTTIQYRTIGEKKTVEEGVIRNDSSEKHISLSKRDKIIIAVVVSVIVALFVLIIVNSAIISGLNGDLSTLQSSLTDVKGAYAGVQDSVNSFQANISQAVEDFAMKYGMVK